MMIVDHDITAVCITEGFSCAATATLIMATTSYLITDADVGRVLPITDGFLTNLTMTAPPPVYEVPSFDEGKQIWTAGYFVLRGSGDNRDAVCITPAGGGFAQWQKSNANMVVNRCIGFRGGLIVVAVPKGSSWSVTLSDAPVVASPTDPPLSSAGARVARNRPSLTGQVSAPVNPGLVRHFQSHETVSETGHKFSA